MKPLLAVLPLFAGTTAAQWLDHPWPHPAHGRRRAGPHRAGRRPTLRDPAPPETDVTKLPSAALRELAKEGNAAAQPLPLGPLAQEKR